MGSTYLGVIKPVSVQQVWPKEATDFTPWLANNLNYLSEKLGMELSLEKTEVACGDFSADIIARDLSTGNPVVIENQYGPSDHKHLGQIITYAAARGATAVIWVAENIRAEHRIAIDLLNRGMKSTMYFYAVELRVIRIDDSRPACTLDVICKPEEEESLSSGAVGSVLSEKSQKYLAFFQGLIDELRNLHFTNARKAQPQNWYTFSSENSEVFTYSVSFGQQRRVRAEVYIDCGYGTVNKKIFDALLAEKGPIEAAVGDELSWERLDTKRACRVAVYRPGRIDSSTEELDEIRQWAIVNLERLKKTFPSKIETVWKTLKSSIPDDIPIAAE